MSSLQLCARWTCLCPRPAAGDIYLISCRGMGVVGAAAATAAAQVGWRRLWAHACFSPCLASVHSSRRAHPNLPGSFLPAVPRRRLFHLVPVEAWQPARQHPPALDGEVLLPTVDRTGQLLLPDLAAVACLVPRGMLPAPLLRPSGGGRCQQRLPAARCAPLPSVLQGLPRAGQMREFQVIAVTLFTRTIFGMAAYFRQGGGRLLAMNVAALQQCVVAACRWGAMLALPGGSLPPSSTPAFACVQHDGGGHAAGHPRYRRPPGRHAGKQLRASPRFTTSAAGDAVQQPVPPRRPACWRWACPSAWASTPTPAIGWPPQLPLDHSLHAPHPPLLQSFWFLAYFPEPLSLAAQSMLARDKGRPQRAAYWAWLLLRWVGCGVQGRGQARMHPALPPARR